MARRANGPALYELLQDGPRNRVASASRSSTVTTVAAQRREPERKSVASSKNPAGKPSGGEAMFPSGFQQMLKKVNPKYAALATVALVILVAVVVRFLDNQQARADQLARRGVANESSTALLASSTTIKPIDSSESASGTNQSRTAPAIADGNSPTGVPQTAAQPVSGWTYLVIATVDPAKSGQMVQFLGANGVEAIAVPRNNGRLHQVMVLPGLPDATSRSGPEGRRIMEAVRAVGSKWKGLNRGNSDFHDAFWDTN